MNIECCKLVMFVGKNRTLRSCYSKYLCSEPFGFYMHTLSWNRDKAKSCEQWEIIRQGDNSWALKSAHGLYLSAKPDGTANKCSKTIRDTERFQIQPVSGGYIIKSIATQKCLAAHADGTLSCKSDPNFGNKETVIEILPIFEFRGPHRFLKLDGKVLFAAGNCLYWTTDDETAVGCSFSIELEDVDLYSIKTWQNKYLEMTGDGIHPSPVLTESCLWQVQGLGDSSFIITGAHGLALGSIEGAAAPVDTAPGIFVGTVPKS